MEIQFERSILVVIGRRIENDNSPYLVVVGGAGADSTPTVNGIGGTGTSNSITGSSVVYAGGGGGASFPFGRSSPTGNGADNTGFGGGGEALAGEKFNGGSGVVIISYVTGTIIATGGNISFDGANTVHTFTSSGTFTTLSAFVSFSISETVTVSDTGSVLPVIPLVPLVIDSPIVSDFVLLNVGYVVSVSESTIVSDLPYYIDNTFIMWEVVALDIEGDRTINVIDETAIGDSPSIGDPYVPLLWTDLTFQSSIWVNESIP